MKASTLADFVIIFVAVSAIITLFSYMGLNWTIKPVPSDMISVGVTLALGAMTAGGLKSKAKLDISAKGSFVNYSLLGIAFTQLILVIHYNSLIWVERLIPDKLAPSIHGLVVILLTVTNFTDSGYKNSDFSQPKQDISIEQEIHIDAQDK
ncbi:hypothetical protein QT972_00125 [Microcoleus sp. herbarium7]|uniref:hypothetical protein n=1 Tax=Microcoleus sp. herbarium7 TaxID=3055435 RepID=UPI002FD13E9E